MQLDTDPDFVFIADSCVSEAYPPLYLTTFPDLMRLELVPAP
jgi:hypothetical protein